MKKEFKKMINETLKSIDWEKITKFYENRTLIWIAEKNIKGNKSIRSSIPTILDLKNELKSILVYIIDSNLPEYSYSHWTIFWFEGDDEIGSQLEVIFSPIRFFISETKNEMSIKNIKEPYMSTEEEIKKLSISLQKAVKEENYELCAELRDKIIELENKTKKKPNARRKKKED